MNSKGARAMEQSIIEALKPRERAEVVAFACKLEALGWWASPLGLVLELERWGAWFIHGSNWIEDPEGKAPADETQRLGELITAAVVAGDDDLDQLAANVIAYTKTGNRPADWMSHPEALPDDLAQWPVDWALAYEERAGIMEHHGGISRDRAEMMAERNVRACYQYAVERPGTWGGLKAQMAGAKGVKTYAEEAREKAERAKARAARKLPPVRVEFRDYEKEIAKRLKEEPHARQAAAHQLGAKISGSPAKAQGIECPGCSRRSVYFWIASDGGTSVAKCNHANSCGYWGTLYDLMRRA